MNRYNVTLKANWLGFGVACKCSNDTRVDMACDTSLALTPYRITDIDGTST